MLNPSSGSGVTNKCPRKLHLNCDYSRTANVCFLSCFHLKTEHIICSCLLTKNAKYAAFHFCITLFQIAITEKIV